MFSGIKEYFSAPLLPLLAGGVLFLSSPLRADIPDLFHFFEEEDLEYAIDSSAEAYRWKLPQGSRWTSEEVRFGKGSLQISPMEEEPGNQAAGWKTAMATTESGDFWGEIHKLTIVAWIRPNTLETFNIFCRFPSALSAPGFFRFAILDSAHKRLYFAATGSEAGKEKAEHHSLQSSEITLTPQEWNHLGVVFNEGEVTFYFNGRPVGQAHSIPVAKIPEVNESRTSIMAVDGLTQGGFVDDFGVFGGQALSSDEMYTLYENGLEAFFHTQNKP